MLPHNRVLLIAFLCICIPTASAQVVSPEVSVGAASPGRVDLGPDGRATVELTVSNRGRAEAAVTIQFSEVAGWTPTADPGTFTLPAAGADGAPSSRVVRVALVTSADPALVRNGSLTITAAWTGGTPSGSGNPQTTVALRFIAPEAPPAPVAPPATPWAAIAGSILGLLFIAGGAAYVGQARRVLVDVPQALQLITVGCDGVYHVTVRNPTARPQTVELRVRDLPSEWFAAFSFPRVTLGPRESTSVPLLVRVPWQAPKGTRAQVVIQARPNAYSPWLRSRSVEARVVDVDPGQVPTGYAA